MTNVRLPHRHPDIDLLRTLAILLMIVYHSAFDLAEFWGWDIDVFGGGWKVLARGTASLFLLLVGISFAVSHGRMMLAEGDEVIDARGHGYRKHLRRAMRILLAALLITIATYLADPRTYVRFGILHLIGVSALLLPLFARLREWNALIGVIIIVLGFRLLELRFGTAALLPFGFLPYNFHTVDYFPLLPWFGVILLGFALGHFVYIRHRRPLFPIKKLPSWLTFPGRHALAFYLIHQPILIVVFSGMLGIPAF